MLYMLLIAHDDQFSPTEQLIHDIHAWIQSMEDRGVRVSGNPLQAPKTAKTVSTLNGVTSVEDGPFSQALEQMCAYEIIDCTDSDKALELAESHPMAKVAKIEVRPIWSELARSG